MNSEILGTNLTDIERYAIDTLLFKSLSNQTIML